MSTKLLPNPRNLTISFSASNHHRILLNNISCNLSFPWNKVPSTISVLLCHNRFCPLNAVGEGDTSSSSSSSSSSSNNDDDVDHHRHHSEEEEEEAAAAREAVSEILQEFGVLKEESLYIALKSPKYVKTLIDSVRELDDLSLWNSWGSSSSSNNQGEEESVSTLRLSFKEKVYHMAKEKGDKGMLPFLESAGLALSSANHVARYLSSETLPNLIHRVKYVKDMFFSDSDDETHIGKNARRMMIHLSIPIDEDVQQTLSFFEKIEARRGGLVMLGSKDACFRCLIESFPRLLLLPVESHMKQMVEFLKHIGVPKGCVRNILLLFPPIIFYDIERNIKPIIVALEKVGAGDEDFGKILLKYPWILSTSIHKNYEEILYFFYMQKVPKASVDRAIKSWPHLLGCSISKLKLMVEQFGELGVRDKKLGQVIASSPQLLLQKPQEFLLVVSFLKDLELDKETVGRILGRCPEIFASSIEKTLKKKLDFLRGIGVSKSHLPRVIRKYPELFVCDVNKTLLPRLKYLMKTGLSKRDVAIMVCRFSPLLGYSIEEVLRPKVEFLVNTMEKPLKDVVDYPRYFSYSLEKKIKPRYRVLKGRNVECSLKDMLGKNDEEFAADFMDVGRLLVPPPSSVE
uniref:Mitochondrial transcription termination factor family protein n=1 Tax=Davidia involucrata TaxID=16924 RepID=A0A5B6Z6F6_DAVIN